MSDCCEQKKKVRPEAEKRALISRLNRIIGQMNGIKRMIEEDRYCDDVLTQLAAADKAVQSLAALILEEHMRTCIVENIQSGNTEVVGEIVDLFKRFR